MATSSVTPPEGFELDPEPAATTMASLPQGFELDQEPAPAPSLMDRVKGVSSQLAQIPRHAYEALAEGQGSLLGGLYNLYALSGYLTPGGAAAVQSTMLHPPQTLQDMRSGLQQQQQDRAEATAKMPLPVRALDKVGQVVGSLAGDAPMFLAGPAAPAVMGAYGLVRGADASQDPAKSAAHAALGGTLGVVAGKLMPGAGAPLLKSLNRMGLIFGGQNVIADEAGRVINQDSGDQLGTIPEEVMRAVKDFGSGYVEGILMDMGFKGAAKLVSLLPKKTLTDTAPPVNLPKEVQSGVEARLGLVTPQDQARYDAQQVPAGLAPPSDVTGQAIAEGIHGQTLERGLGAAQSLQDGYLADAVQRGQVERQAQAAADQARTDLTPPRPAQEPQALPASNPYDIPAALDLAHLILGGKKNVQDVPARLRPMVEDAAFSMYSRLQEGKSIQEARASAEHLLNELSAEKAPQPPPGDQARNAFMRNVVQPRAEAPIPEGMAPPADLRMGLEPKPAEVQPPEPPVSLNDTLDNLPLQMQEAIAATARPGDFPPPLLHLQEKALTFKKAKGERALAIYAMTPEEAQSLTGKELKLWQSTHEEAPNVPGAVGQGPEAVGAGTPEGQPRGTETTSGAPSPRVDTGELLGRTPEPAQPEPRSVTGVRPAPPGPGEGNFGPPRLKVEHAAHGNETTLYVHGGKSYPATYALVDAAQFRVDTAEGQNRNSNSVTAKVGARGERFIPDAALSDTPFAQDGPPTVLEDGTVAGGNTRLKGIVHSISVNPEKAAEYRGALSGHLSRFGIDPKTADGMKEPVLVRVVKTPDTRLGMDTLVGEINQSTTSAMSATETAAQDARILPDNFLDSLHVAEGEIFASAIRKASNGRARDTLMFSLFPEIARSTDVGAKLTPQMLKRMEAASLAKGLRFDRNSTALDMILESPDAGMNIVRDALVNKAGLLAKANSYQESRTVDGDPMGDLSDAVEKFASLKDAGRDPGDFAKQAQGSLFGAEASKEELSDKAIELVGKLADLSRSRAKLGTFLEDYAKKIIEAPDKNQGELFGEKTPGPALRANLPDLGILKTTKENIIPALKGASYGAAHAWDQMLSVVNPTARGPEAKQGAQDLTARIGEMGHRMDQWRVANEKFARGVFDKIPNVADRYKLLAPFEREGSEAYRSHPDLYRILKTWEQAVDMRKEIVREVTGRGTWGDTVRHYFKHLWQDPKAAEDWFAGSRPLEGPKGFMKQRTWAFMEDAMKPKGEGGGGLTPRFDNPVDAMMYSLVEQDRYILAHSFLNDLKGKGLAKFVATGMSAPPHFRELQDRMGTVWGPAKVPVWDAMDPAIMKPLEKVAQALGVRSARVASTGNAPAVSGGFGLSWQGGNRVETRIGGTEGILAHEIGHQLDHKFGLWGRMFSDTEKVKPSGEVNKAQSSKARGVMQRELRALSDLMGWDADTGEGHATALMRKKAEKMANLLAAYIRAPERFKSVAPTAYGVFDGFLRSDPRLRPLTEIKGSTTINPQAVMADLPGPTLIGKWFVHDGPGRVLENYLSRGLEDSPGFKAWRAWGNNLNQMQLGFSFFHAGFTTVDAMTSTLANAIKYGTEAGGAAIHGRGTAAAYLAMRAALKVAETPVSWLTNPVRGSKMMKAWNGQASGDLAKAMAPYVRAMETAGGTPLDPVYLNHSIKAWSEALHQGKLPLAAWETLPAIVEAVAKPTMQWLVPRQKMGVFMDMADRIITANPGKSMEELTPQFQAAWRSVDNRLGQLRYDTLFWDKTFKDLMMASTRSVGWNLGTVRELGGSIVDTGKALVGQGGFTDKMAYAVALPILTGMMGAVTYYMIHGKGPEKLYDYYYIPTGKKNEDGSEVRIQFPSYMKDVFAYSKHPVTTIRHKLHPTIGVTADMLQNKDYYGDMIRNPDDPIVQQMAQVAQYMGRAYLPFGVRNIMDQRKLGNTGAVPYLSMVGITPAPKGMDRTKAQEMMYEFAKQRPKDPRTPEEVTKSQVHHDLETKLRNKSEGAMGELQKAVASGQMPLAAAQRIMKQARQDPTALRFKSLSIPEAFKVMDVATLQEKAMFLPLLAAKLRAGLRNLTSDERKTYLAMYQSLKGKQPATTPSVPPSAARATPQQGTIPPGAVQRTLKDGRTVWVVQQADGSWVKVA